jgi:hypothetical protein
MSERNEGGKWVGAFVLGVIVGLLLTVGVGAALWMAYVRRAEMLYK